MKKRKVKEQGKGWIILRIKGIETTARYLYDRTCFPEALGIEHMARVLEAKVRNTE